MHALAPYSLRCYDKNISRRNEDRYHRLDRMGQYDVFELVLGFLNAHKRYNIVEDTKQVYRFSKINADGNNRIITCWMHSGYYGMKSDIVNIENDAVEFEKTEKHVDVTKYFISFWLPKNVTEGVALMHTVRSDGVKTLFQKEFQPYFSRYVPDRTLQVNVLAYDKALQKWANADTKELTVERFAGYEDIADKLAGIKAHDLEFKIKAKRKNSMGRFFDFFSDKGEHYQLVQSIGELGTSVKAVVLMDGKTRTFRIGPNSRQSLCEIEMPDTVEIEAGVPTYDSIKEWSTDILREYCQYMYNGLRIT